MDADNDYDTDEEIMNESKTLCKVELEQAIILSRTPETLLKKTNKGEEACAKAAYDNISFYCFSK